MFVSTKNTLSNAERLAAKLCGYARTDKNTPIIGALCFKYIETFETFGVDPEQWWAQFPESEQWPNEIHSDYRDLFEMFLPGFNMIRFCKWYDTLDQNYETWFSAPVCCTLPEAAAPKVLAQVGPDLHDGPELASKRATKPGTKATTPKKSSPKAKPTPAKKGAKPKPAGPAVAPTKGGKAKGKGKEEAP